MGQIWGDMLRAYLHDPPDKALDIRGHVSRARRYASRALGVEMTDSDLKRHEDLLASAIERLPMPSPGDDYRWAVSPENGKLTVGHPLSGVQIEVAVPKLEEDRVAAEIERLLRGLPDDRTRFYALWRLWSEKLRGINREFARLPADTRTPDHTIWQHNDITAALAACGWGENTAFLLFSIGPVQSFIQQARTLRDLWTGSMILSWLVFRGMTPILEELGPAAFVFPAMRGQPLMDRWLRDYRQGESNPLKALIEEPKEELRTTPCLPNRFLALVPSGTDGGHELAKKCEAAARKAWCEMCEQVHSRLDRELRERIPPPLYAGWDRHWQAQCCGFFDVRTVVLPWKDAKDEELIALLSQESGPARFQGAFPDAAALRGLAKAIPDGEWPGDPHERYTPLGQRQHRIELCQRVLAAAKAVAHFPNAIGAEAGADVPPKCSLLGSCEQMGPAALNESRTFWEEARQIKLGGIRLGRQERLCAPALVKRFASRTFLARELGVDEQELGWSDTATIAAARWLGRHPQIQPQQIRNPRWSGQWLHWPMRTWRGDEDDEEACPDPLWTQIESARRDDAPPAYYAILMLDGDQMGQWLSGAKSPPVREVMHPKLVGYYSGLTGEVAIGLPRERLVKAGLNARRHVGPALHSAISEALANFALHIVPEIVKRHFGELIYAGGDDVLALLPTETALACAGELRDTFRAAWKTDPSGTLRLLMGERATLSAGIAVVHYKEDLRFALAQARAAEKSAKESGRDILELRILRRSGEHSQALCPWEFAATVQSWVRAFVGTKDRPGASDRWAYHLRGELDTLKYLDAAAMLAEIRRQVDRAETPTRRWLAWAGSNAQSAARWPAADPAPHEIDAVEPRAGESLAAAFDDYRTATKPVPDGSAAEKRFSDDGQALEQFVALCQSASFLARGRDR